MPDAAEELFEEQRVAADDAAIDQVIHQAGGDPRAAIRALLVALAEIEATTSFGYRRGRRSTRLRS